MVAISMLAACGDNLEVEVDIVVDRPESFGFESGNRLRVGWLRTQGGGRLPNGFYDRERREHCTFAERSDATYCLPDAEFSGEYFADAACSEPLGHRREGDISAPERYLHFLPLDGRCGVEQELREIGDAVTPTTVFYYDGERCTRRSAGADRYFAIGPPLPFSAFARATKVREPTSWRLQREVLVTDDGARALIGFYDPALAASCDFVDTSPPHCLPASRSATTYFTDAGCTTAVAAIFDACSDDTRYARIYAPEQPDGFELFELGASISPAALYASRDSCLAVQGETGALYELRGPLAADETVAVATERLGAGQVETIVGVSGELKRILGLVDVSHGPCDLAVAADAKLRCLPRPAESLEVRLYTEPLCLGSKRARRLRSTGDGVYSNTASFTVPNGIVTDVYALTSEVAPDTHYWVVNEVCTLATWDPAEQRLFWQGERIPPTTFALFEPFFE